MQKTLNRWLGCLIVIAAVAGACAPAPTQAPVQTQLVYPTIIITQFVTQVVATPTITPIPTPTKPVQVITSAPNTGWDPLKVNIYYPLKGCVASRLHRNDVAFVSSGAIGLYVSPDIGDAPTFRELEPGELIDIESDPQCVNNMIVWKVGTADQMVGYAAEGNGQTYWLLPMPPTTDEVITKEEVKEIEKNKGSIVVPVK